MKKVLLTLLGIVLVVGVLAGAGFIGYRIGYMRGARITQVVQVPNNLTPPFDRNDRFNQDKMPQFHPGMNDRNFGPEFAPNRFPMMRNGRGFGFFFAPLQFIWRIVVFGLIIWFFYWLFAKSGLQVSFNSRSVQTPAVEASAPPKKENEE